MDHNISDFACFLAGNTCLNKMAKLQQVIYILKVAVDFMQSHQKAFENPETAFREVMEETSIEELDKFLAECKFYAKLF